MSESRSRLPHWQKEGASYFVTWRLHGSLPSKVTADLLTTEGAKFLEQDRLLDAAATGPRWLLQPAVAASVAKILLDSEVEGKCELASWVLMPNHVHALLRPRLDLPKVVSWIKACSARDANRILSRAGSPFWARDYFDRWLRGGIDEAKIATYIQQNPVNAGLCPIPEAWRWSSSWAARD